MAGGPAAGCLQTHTVIAGESCDGIAASFKITSDEFYGMNPGLHHAGDHICDNLDNDKKYCVCMKEPCVPEPAPTTGNSTASTPGQDASTGSAASKVDTSSSSNPNSASAAIAGSPISSPSPSPSSSSSSSSPPSSKSPLTVNRSLSSPAAISSAAVSEKIKISNRAYVSIALVALGVVAVIYL
ncbi:hypothetical protein BCR42DRAFT_442207 [Absidia repens]|uniref:LysM domain-containing protein n=1 Tax=Absidia repens TaxID=90262 RepID=A0A1X2I3J8_9FUNG|nr:hypothetical protein BCR42DRAFT_442207 [Absidia repens]